MSRIRDLSLAYSPSLTGVGLVEALAFERLLADLSANFANLTSDRVETGIEEGLRRLIAFLGYERSSFGEFVGEDGRLDILFSVSAEGVQPLPRGPFNAALGWYLGELRAGRTVILHNAPDDLPATAINEREYCRQSGLHSHIGIPLKIADRLFGAIGFASFRAPRRWPDEVIVRLKIIGEVCAQTLARSRVEAELRASLAEVRQLKERLVAENTYLRHTGRSNSAANLTSRSARFNQILEEIRQVAPTSATVLLQGETGTGKEVLAGAIHEFSGRQARPIIKINCAALPSTLIEAELFGREKGAYTGALARQMGRFELANGSTILLDEIGELPLELQTKLLRVLQSGEFERVGGTRTLKVDARVIAATNRDLSLAVGAGEFREDLFYRLNVFPIVVPPLRERPEDIALLAWTFVKEFSESMGKPIERISEASMARLHTYHWPGNIRELRNVIERAMILGRAPTLEIALNRPSPPLAAAPDSTSLQHLQRNHILRVLEQTGWRIRGSGGAAERLGVKPTTLESRMRKLGIERP